MPAFAGTTKWGSVMALELTSTAFAHNGAIPRRYTCQGDDVSVPLAWSGAPPATKSFVLIVDDPDAPDPKAPTTTWVHWLLYDLPPGTAGLPEGVAHAAPVESTEALTDDDIPF